MSRRRATRKFTIWKTNGLDVNGQPSYDGPYTVSGRYEKRSIVYLNADGRETRGDSVIYIEEDVARVSDTIFIGESASATPEKGSHEINDYRAIPNLRGTRTEYRLII